MVLDESKLSVLHAPLQPHTKEGDSTHPTGFRRDGYCWGDSQDPGNHFIGGVVTKEFLEYSKDQGNDLMTQRPGFPGLKDGCRWCLCVNRWKEALLASEKLGDRVVPRVDLSSTALSALKGVKLDDLKKYESTKPVIAVAFYSTYGHIGALAEEVIKGVEASGAVVKPYVIKETLPEEVLTKMHAGSSLSPKYPVITPNDLAEVDGLILGAPTRYGRLPAQVDAFFDATGGLWAKGGLVGKFVTMFTSTAGQHSGQESTFLTTYPFFAHLVYVPIGYANQAVGSLEQVQGGSPYGASTIAGADGSRKPLALELEIAQFQGKFFADFVTTFTKGKHAAIAPAATPASDATTSTPVVPAAAAKEVPTLAAPVAVGTSTHAKEEGGYTVDSAPTTAEATANATPAPEEATEKPTTADAPVAETQTAEKAAPAAAAAAPAATKEATPAPAASTATPAPAKKEAPKKKKGFFASCCGDSGIDK
ncbi:hypothetical protein IAU59_006070 [Kwoniella sp. CBS 9459]